MRIFIVGALCIGLAAPLAGQVASKTADIDEAFRLAGVRDALASLPSHVKEMTVAAVAQLPKDQRQQMEPLIKETSLKFLDPNGFYRQLRAYFVSHYDGTKMATFLALEKTSAYRTMHRFEAAAETAAAEAGRRSFEANLKTDPPPPARMEILQRLDEATNETGLQVRLMTVILNSMSAGMGAQMPADLDAQSAAFMTKIKPALAEQVLHRNLYVYRDAEDADLEDCVSAAQQPAVAWFNRNLQSAILAVAADRVKQAGESVKSQVDHHGK